MTRTTLRKLFISPPLAFARIGPSSTPLDAYYWGPNDNSPDGTGKTTIVPAETLDVAEDGTVKLREPEAITFKDKDGFRPVCPFFELWGVWNGAPDGAPITDRVLADWGLTRKNLRWTIEVANLKPFFMTQDPDTRIEARVELAGTDTTRRPLLGRSPAGAQKPLVPVGQHIQLGTVQLTEPNSILPELRLRFTPGAGRFYGPTDLKRRWPAVDLPEGQLFLNAQSKWCGWMMPTDDPRGWPPGQYAGDKAKGSYGLVDDICDGIILCTLTDADGKPYVARARIVVAPPDYAPDRRHVVSLADGLADRVRRADVFTPEYTADAQALEREIQDLMERVFETMGLMNLDVFNDRVDKVENQLVALDFGDTYVPGRNRPFGGRASEGEPPEHNPLPLTTRGRIAHRRYVTYAALADFVRTDPERFLRAIRSPLDLESMFDWRMPALMKDAGDTPLTLTPRQYELVRRWVETLRPGSAPQ